MAVVHVLLMNGEQCCRRCH